MTNGSIRGTLIASAVAALVASGAGCAGKMDKASDTSMAAHCAGVNSCKGQSACKGVDNSCKGQNSCKGKGWIEVPTAKDCTDKGGTVMTMNM